MDKRVFLDGKIDLGEGCNHVAIQSFQGAGNDLLGQLIEKVTNVFVGSDANCHYTFDRALGLGAFGELETSKENRLFFTKTNHPIDSKSQEFFAQKLVCVVRNPMDIIHDAADEKNLFGTGHGLDMQSNYQSEDLVDWWQKWVITQAQNIQANHEYVTTQIKDKLPTIFIRYEDLQKNPYQSLSDVFKFALNVESIQGTVLEKRIKEISDFYASPNANFCMHADQFSRAQKQDLSNELESYADFFGYNKSQVESALSTEASVAVNEVALFAELNAPALLECYSNYSSLCYFRKCNIFTLKQDEKL